MQPVDRSHDGNNVKFVSTVKRLGVNFINVIRTNFSYERRFSYVQVTRENNVHTKNLYV